MYICNKMRDQIINGINNNNNNNNNPNYLYLLKIFKNKLKV